MRSINPKLKFFLNLAVAVLVLQGVISLIGSGGIFKGIVLVILLIIVYGYLITLFENENKD